MTCLDTLEKGDDVLSFVAEIASLVTSKVDVDSHVVLVTQRIIDKKIPHTGDKESLDRIVGPIQFWRGCVIYL